MITEKEILIISLDSAKEFSNRLINDFNNISTGAKMRFCEGQEIHFANSEAKYVLNESVRGKEVYVVQLCEDPYSLKSINDNLIATIAAVNAAKFGDAQLIKVVLPHFPYSRQDKLLSREPLMAQLVARFLEISGAKQVITLDIHSQAIKGYFYEIDMIDLHASKLIRKYIEENLNIENLAFVAPDVGSSKRNNYYARRFGCRLAVIDKIRDYSKPQHENIVSSTLVGDVEGCDAIIIDDMVASGGTLLNACEILKSNGAKDIHLAVSIPFFTGDSHKRFDAAYKEGLFKTFVGTNAVWWNDEFKKQYPWYHEISITMLFAEAINALSLNHSIDKVLN